MWLRDGMNGGAKQLRGSHLELASGAKVERERENSSKLILLTKWSGAMTRDGSIEHIFLDIEFEEGKNWYCGF